MIDRNKKAIREKTTKGDYLENQHDHTFDEFD